MDADEDGDLSYWIAYGTNTKKEVNDQEQHYLWSKTGKKINMKRKGGSNGNEINLKTFLSGIATCKKSPRMGYAAIQLLKDRDLVLTYISSNTAKREVKHSNYNFPKHELQIAILGDIIKKHQMLFLKCSK